MGAENKLYNKTVAFKGGNILVQFNQADQEPAVIQIYEDIGEDPFTGAGFTAKDFSAALEDIPRSKPIDIRINSAGGSVWDGLAIKTLLDEWPSRKTASIDGMAASVASWMAMSVDEIRAPKHAQMFIHDAWGFAMGNAEDMLPTANQLDKSSAQIADIYARKTGMSSSECRDMMKEGTLMTAKEAHEMGFIDRLTEDKEISNFSDKQVSNMRGHLEFVRNSISAAKKGGAKTSNNENQDKIVNRKQMIALLNKWGVKFQDSATDEELYALIEK